LVGYSETTKAVGQLVKHVEAVREHSLTIFLLVTDAAWLALFVHMKVAGKWGQVVGNIVSGWTQILGARASDKTADRNGLER